MKSLYNLYIRYSLIPYENPSEQTNTFGKETSRPAVQEGGFMPSTTMSDWTSIDSMSCRAADYCLGLIYVHIYNVANIPKLGVPRIHNSIVPPP